MGTDYTLDVHPLWSEGRPPLPTGENQCIDCHTGGSPSGNLLLDTTPSAACNNILSRLDTGSCNMMVSEIVCKPATNGCAHGGLEHNQFDISGTGCSGSDCQTVLDWCNDGAVCP